MASTIYILSIADEPDPECGKFYVIDGDFHHVCDDMDSAIRLANESRRVLHGDELDVTLVALWGQSARDWLVQTENLRFIEPDGD